MPEPKPRGRCPKCDRSISLTKWGLIRHHRSDTVENGRHLYRCAGAGYKPVPVDPDEVTNA